MNQTLISPQEVKHVNCKKTHTEIVVGWGWGCVKNADLIAKSCLIASLTFSLFSNSA
jgi:hypothetical protein